jgi:hypothetical protein
MPITHKPSLVTCEDVLIPLGPDVHLSINMQLDSLRAIDYNWPLGEWSTFLTLIYNVMLMLNNPLILASIINHNHILVNLHHPQPAAFLPLQTRKHHSLAKQKSQTPRTSTARTAALIIPYYLARCSPMRPTSTCEGIDLRTLMSPPVGWCLGLWSLSRHLPHQRLSGLHPG